MKNNHSPGLVDKRGAAKLLGVSVSTFDRLRIKRGIIPAVTMLERPVLFYEARVRELLKPVASEGNGKTVTDQAAGIIQVEDAKRLAKRKGGRK